MSAVPYGPVCPNSFLVLSNSGPQQEEEGTVVGGDTGKEQGEGKKEGRKAGRMERKGKLEWNNRVALQPSLQGQGPETFTIPCMTYVEISF